MGVIGPDLGQRVAGLGDAVKSGRRQTVIDMAQAAKAAHLAIMKRDSGGDLRLSGVGRRRGRPGNARIGARYDIRGVRAEIRATGPVPLIDQDTAGRVIRSAYLRGRQVRGFVGPTSGGQFRGDRRAVLNIPGVGFRRSARHPGTKGKDTWRRGQDRARPQVERVAARKTTNILLRAL